MGWARPRGPALAASPGFIRPDTTRPDELEPGSRSRGFLAHQLEQLDMKIKQHFFPVILLVVFFLVIAAGMATGYWQTHGGGGRGRTSAVITDAYETSVMGVDS